MITRHDSGDGVVKGNATHTLTSGDLFQCKTETAHTPPAYKHNKHTSDYPKFDKQQAVQQQNSKRVVVEDNVKKERSS